jgi:hypothetical protein
MDILGLNRLGRALFTHALGAGELELTGKALQLPGDTGLTLIAYTVEPREPLAVPRSASSPSSPNRFAVEPEQKGQ